MKCTCDGLEKAISQLKEEMEEKETPMVFEAVCIYEMEHGAWIECKCEAKNNIKEIKL